MKILIVIAFLIWALAQFAPSKDPNTREWVISTSADTDINLKEGERLIKYEERSNGHAYLLAKIVKNAGTPKIYYYKDAYYFTRIKITEYGAKEQTSPENNAEESPE